MQMLVDKAIPLVVILMMVVVGMELATEDFRCIHACPRTIYLATAGSCS
jgi:hypothetical protein